MADQVQIDLIVKAISQGFDKIEKDLKSVGDSSKKAGDEAKKGNEGFKAFGDSMKSLGTIAAGAAVIIGGALVAGLAKTVMAASDAEESMSKFNVVFKDLEGGPEALAVEIDKLSEATGRSKYELIGAVGALGDLFQPLGFSTDAAADLSLQMTSLAIDLSSFNNMPMDEALQRLQGTLIGSHENALAFGVVINENTLKAQMMKDGTDKLTGAQFEQAKVQARLTLLMDGTTAAQGDAIRTADGFANQVKALQGDMSDFAVEIGQVLLPTVTDLITEVRELGDEALPEVKKAFTEVVGLISDFTDEAGDASAGMDGITESIKKFTSYVAFLRGAREEMSLLKGVLGGTSDNMNLLGRAVGFAKGALAALKGVATGGKDAIKEYGEFIERTLGFMQDWPIVGALVAGAIRNTTDQTRAAATVTEYMTDAVKDDVYVRQQQAIAVEGSTEAIAENTGETERAVRVNEELADKVAQLSAQETALDPAVRAGNLALEQQATAATLAAEKAEELRVMTEALQTAMTGNFKTALEDTTGATTNWTQELFNQASQLGLTQAQMVLLAGATGNYTAEQIEAALQTAAMQEKVTALAAAIANDGMSIEAAIADLNAFQSAMDANTGATQRFIDKLNAIPSRIQVQIDVHGGEGVTAHGGYQNPDAGGGSGGAATSGAGGASSGAGGGHVGPGAASGIDFVVPPGFPNDSYLQPVQSGERVQVTPAGQSSSSGMTVNNNFNGPVNPGQVMREMAIVQAMMGA